MTEVRRLISQSMQRFGRLDILVNNAGMALLKSLEERTPEDIADVVLFIVSDQARWLTGQNIHAGGGVVM